MRIFLVLLTVFPIVLASSTVGIAAWAAPVEGPSVTLPLNEYLQMKKKLEVPSITTVEEVRLSGSLGEGAPLTIGFYGSASGQYPLQSVLEQSDNFSLSGCSGSAMLQAHDGEISILPQKERFSLECRLITKTRTEVALTVIGALSVRSTVQGGELIEQSSDPARRSVVLSRASRGGSDTDGPVTAVARYRISVMPDDTAFQHSFTFYNPGRSSRALKLAFRNGESVQEVRTSASYDQGRGELSLKLPPGESTVVVSGQSKGAAFKPWIESSQQYAVIESHPLLQLGITSQARRISLAETGIAPRFSGGSSFFLKSDDSFAWNVKKLAVFDSQSYTVADARYLVYVPAKGESIIEAQFTIDNRGTPEIALDVPGRAVYEEIDGVPQALYKDDAGKLLVHLPSGQHRILIQYRPEGKFGGPLSVVVDRLLRPQAVISELALTVSLADAWSAPISQGASRIRSSLDWGVIVGAAILLGFYFLFFRSLGAEGRLLWAAASGPALLGWWNEELIAPLIAFWLVGWALHKRDRIWKFVSGIFASLARTLKSRWAAIAIAPLALLATVVIWVGSRDSSTVVQPTAMQEMAAPSAVRSMPQAKNKKAMRFSKEDADEAEGGGAPMVADQAEEVGGGGGFQGVPARIRIPSGQVYLSYDQALIEADTRIPLRILLVNLGWLAILPLAGICSAFVVLYRNRRKLPRYFWNFK